MFSREQHSRHTSQPAHTTALPSAHHRPGQSDNGYVGPCNALLHNAALCYTFIWWGSCAGLLMQAVVHFPPAQTSGGSFEHAPVLGHCRGDRAAFGLGRRCACAACMSLKCLPTAATRPHRAGCLPRPRHVGLHDTPAPGPGSAMDDHTRSPEATALTSTPRPSGTSTASHAPHTSL